MGMGAKASIDAAGAIAEAIEQLDELSKGTYGSYIKKAAKDMQDRAYDATPIAGDEQHAKIAKRVKGIGRAVKALGALPRGAGIAYTKKVN